MILLLDMDEVLVDFDSGACEAHGITSQQMNHYRHPGQWSLIEPIGRAKTAGMSALTLDEFWQPIHDAGAGFWENLNKLPWYDEVVGWAEINFEEWYIVSSPSRETCSYTGKVNWLKREFGSQFDRFFLTPYKELLATPNRILLDDREDNISEFEKHGGQGMLFPTRGGRLHQWADSPMSNIQFTNDWRP